MVVPIWCPFKDNEFQFGACETSMQVPHQEHDGIDGCLWPWVSEMVDALSKKLCAIPGHCKVAMLSIVCAMIIASRDDHCRRHVVR
jgi:hypothetical protein